MAKRDKLDLISGAPPVNTPDRKAAAAERKRAPGHTGARTHGHTGTREPAFLTSTGRTWQRPDGETMVRKTVHFPAPLLDLVRIRAKADRRTFSQVVVDALGSYLKGEK